MEVVWPVLSWDQVVALRDWGKDQQKASGRGSPIGA